MTDPLQPPHPATDPDRLAALDAYELTAGAPDPAFDGVVLLARTLCAAPAALISLVSDDRQWFLARSGFGPSHTPLRQSVCAHALDDTAPLVIPDLRVDARTCENPLVAGPPGLRFYAGAPLRTPTGQTLGTVCVLDTVPRPGGLSEEQLEGLQALAGLVTGQLELHRLSRLKDAEIARLGSGNAC